MKYVRPDYFDRFECIKGDCRHSCCTGWEIDIDDESYERFLNVPGELGNRLKSAISKGADGPYFAMRADGRCPFLNDDGLCDLILGLGKDSLCQICADHPRFRSFYSDREEIGLGLCCEAAGRMILSNTDQVRFIEEGEEKLTADEEELLSLRAELTEIAQNRTWSVNERVERMLAYAELELETDLQSRAAFLMTLEHLEDTWPERLARLASAADISPLAETKETEVAFEQLMVYLLCRHLPAALEDDDLAGHILYCVLIWRIIRALVALEGFSMEGIVEICREYSAEIEYSDENIGAILDRLAEE